MAQLLLLFLFLGPMLSMSFYFNDENNEVIVTDNAKRFVKQWQRATNIEFFYLISNATVDFVVIFRSADQRYSPFISFPFNINLVINNFLAIACFDCWKNGFGLGKLNFVATLSQFRWLPLKPRAP